MPTYVYEHPETGQTKEIVQRMSEPHEYSEDGIQWRRIFDSPNASIDTFGNMSPFDKQAFIKQTAKKGMTVGDMWDESKRLSDKRAAKVGKDFVKVNAENEYKHRTGKAHPMSEQAEVSSKHLDVKI